MNRLVFLMLMTNSADPDQLFLFAKTGLVVFSRRRVKYSFFFKLVLLSVQFVLFWVNLLEVSLPLKCCKA